MLAHAQDENWQHPIDWNQRTSFSADGQLIAIFFLFSKNRHQDSNIF